MCPFKSFHDMLGFALRLGRDYDKAMTFRGRVEHGVVVLDPAHSLPDGTEVEVLPLPSQSARPGEALEKLAGKAQDFPTDLAERHDHYLRRRGIWL
jgi:hypothetical protein